MLRGSARGADAAWFEHMALPSLPRIEDIALWVQSIATPFSSDDATTSFGALDFDSDPSLKTSWTSTFSRRLGGIEDNDELPGILLVIFFVPGLFGIMWYMLGCKPHQVVPA